MSCIYQYYNPDVENQTEKGVMDDSVPLLTTPTSDDDEPSSKIEAESDPIGCKTEVKVSASDLADCRAANWILKKKLREYEVTIENLEHLVTTLVDKQHQILSEMFNLRIENQNLQSEFQLQREYHLLERNTLMKELHDSRTMRRDLSLSLESISKYARADDSDEEAYSTESETEIQDQRSRDSHEEREVDVEDELPSDISDISSTCSESSESESAQDSDEYSESGSESDDTDSSTSTSESD